MPYYIKDPKRDHDFENHPHLFSEFEPYTSYAPQGWNALFSRSWLFGGQAVHIRGWSPLHLQNRVQMPKQRGSRSLTVLIHWCLGRLYHHVQLRLGAGVGNIHLPTYPSIYPSIHLSIQRKKTPSRKAYAIWEHPRCDHYGFPKSKLPISKNPTWEIASSECYTCRIPPSSSRRRSRMII